MSPGVPGQPGQHSKTPMSKKKKKGIYKSKDLRETNKNESNLVDWWGCFNSLNFVNHFNVKMLFLKLTHLKYTYIQLLG